MGLMSQSLTALYLQNPQLANALRRQSRGAQMLQQGGDSSPVDHPLQGFARLAQALVGGYEQGQADKEIKGADEARKARIASILRDGEASPPQMQAPAMPTQPVAPRQPVGQQFLPPAGVDPEEDYLVRTVFGEARGEPAQGQQAVAHVIRNRARAANMPIRDVVLAPGQFEPWGNPQTRAQLEGLDPASPEYQAILANVRGGTQDPTGGATHFYSPTAQAAAGRPTPAWAQGQGQDIGRHRFYNLPYSAPRGAAPAGDTIPAQMPAQAPGAPPAPRTPDAAAHYMAEAQRLERQAMALEEEGAHGQASLRMQMAQGARQMAMARAPQPSETEQLFALAGIDPRSPDGQRITRQILEKKANPPPLVNIDQKGEGTFAQERGKTMAARATGWEDAETKGNERLRSAQQFRAALDGIETGFGTQTQITLGQIAKKLGVPSTTVDAMGLDVNSTAKREEIRSLANRMVLGALGAGGFPAQGFSNADRDFLTAMQPGLMNSAEGNKAILALTEEGAKRDIAISRAWREWRKQNGESPDSVRRFEDEKMPALVAPDGTAQRIIEDSGWKDTTATGNIPTIADPAEAQRLPPGTQFRTPDGRTLRVPAR
jgi:spore germination cell wall hydrolase CwlJ-like protein